MSKRRKLDLDQGVGRLTHNPFARLARPEGRAAGEEASGISSDGALGGEFAEEASFVPGPAERQTAIELRRERKGRGGKVVTLVQWLRGRPADEEVAALAKRLAKGLGAGARAAEGVVTVQGDLSDRVETLLRREWGEQLEIIRATR